MALSKITADSITANVISSALIANGEITFADIANNTITGAKIASATITGDKIASATIGSSNLTSTGVSAGVYGGSGNTVNITVDSQGRITAAANVAANAGSSQWTTTGSDIYYNTGKVGIGTIAPASKFVVANGSIQALEFNPTGGTAGGAYIQGYNRTSFVYIPVEIIASSFAVYPQGGGQKVQVNFNGLGLGGAAPSSGIGITFPATQDPSSDANTLDDYEEGTWTPNIGGNATYYSQTGRYVKIGNTVNLYMYLRPNVVGTGNANGEIYGVPFAANRSSVAVGPVLSVGYYQALGVSTTWLGAGMSDATTILLLGQSAAATTSGGLTGCMANATQIELSGTYIAN